MPRVVQQWHSVAVADSLEIAVRRAAWVVAIAPVAFVGAGQIDADAVLGFVFVENGVALVVTGFTNQPREDAQGIDRVGDARVRVFAVEGEDVVLGDGAPVDIAIGVASPTLDSREQPFDARAVAADAVAVDFVFVNHSEPRARARSTLRNRDQVFGAGEDEDIGLLGVVIPRQAFVGLARDRRQRKAPAEAEGAVAAPES